MKIVPDCVPCAYKICLSAMNSANLDDKTKFEAFSKLSGYIPTLGPDITPGLYHSKALHFLSSYVGIDDMFKDAKAESNHLALSCMDYLVKLVQCADDPLYMAFNISVAGNIIDMGITPDYDLNGAIDAIPDSTFTIDFYKEFRQLALESGKVMIIGDNSGEIAFDILLVKELQKLGIEVVYTVKGGPVLNDATMEDALQVGMPDVCRVITNGNNLLGTDFGFCSEEFKDVFKKAGAVIAKGQANFESLEGLKAAGNKTFFVLRVKCECVGKCADAPFGSLLLKRNEPR